MSVSSAAISPFTLALQHLKKYQSLTTEQRHEDLASMLNYVALDANKNTAIQAQLITALFNLFPHCNAQDRGLIAAIVDKLAAHSQARKDIIDIVAIENVMALLDDETITVRAAITQIVYRLTLYPDTLTSLLNGGAIPALTKLLFEAKQDNKQHNQTLTQLIQLVTASLSNLSNRYTKFQPQDIKQMVNLMTTQYAHHPDIISNTLKCFNQISMDFDLKAVLIANNVVEAALVVLSQPLNVEIQRYASITIMSLTVDEEGKSRVIRTPGAIDSLCKLAAMGALTSTKGQGVKSQEPIVGLYTGSSVDAAVRSNSIQALRNVCENPSGLSAAGPILILYGDVMLEILEVYRVADVLLHFLSQTNTQLVYSALQLFQQLLYTENGVESAWSLTNIVPLLYHIMSSPLYPEDVQSSAAARLLSFMEKHPDAHTQAKELYELTPTFALAAKPFPSLLMRLSQDTPKSLLEVADEEQQASIQRKALAAKQLLAAAADADD